MVEGITFTECIMDHLAKELKEDPLEFRKKNLIPDGKDATTSCEAFYMTRVGCRGPYYFYTNFVIFLNTIIL